MRKKRSESFFGIHFDFHAMPGQTVCEEYRPELIARLLDEAKPDFVQCDTKGHAGLSSYPTDIGNRASTYREDPLAMWRKLTAQRDIALYAHHSGLYDRKVAEQHPDWAVVDEDGNVSEEYLSPFSPYAEEFLIPQIKEMYDRYGIDGVWVDGECWGLYLDYGKYATEAYFNEYKKAPAKRGEEGYEEYREFCREGFRRYVDRYVKALKAYAPDFEVTSNWFYSAYMPDPVSTKVDFLSGDYDCSNAVKSARFHSRCLEARDMTWDLMMWGQHALPCSWETKNRSTKELVQYCQEAAGTIAHGGAFQYFNIIYGGGGVIQEWMIPTWVEVAKFCRERQEACFGAKVVPEIAILYPEAKTKLEANNLYSLGYPELASLRGWIDLLQDSGASSSVIYEYQTADKLESFPLLVVPATDRLKADTVKNICAYIEKGGKVMIDRKSLKFFGEKIGIHQKDSATRLVYLNAGTALAAAECKFATLEGMDARTVATAYEANIYSGETLGAALCSPIFDGALALAVDLGNVYNKNQSSAIRDFARSLLSSVGFESIVSVKGECSDYVEVVLTEKNGGLRVNLLNTAGPHSVGNVRSYGQIPPLYEIEVKIKSDRAPKNVEPVPAQSGFEWSYDGKTVNAKLAKLSIHTCIKIDY